MYESTRTGNVLEQGVVLNAPVMPLCLPCFTDDIRHARETGKCDCGRDKTSATYNICVECSKRRHQCEVCLVDLEREDDSK